MKKGNPFTLSFGKSPTELISRHEHINEIVDVFQSDNPMSHAYLIEGIRGCGKTVLMTSIEKELAKNEDWIVVDLNSTQDLLSDLAFRLVDACKNFSDVLKNGFNVSIAGFGIGINGDKAPQDNVSIISEIIGSPVSFFASERSFSASRIRGSPLYVIILPTKSRTGTPAGRS